MGFNKRVVWLLEAVGAMILAYVSYQSYEYIFEHNTLIPNREYAKHMDYLIRAKDANGKPLLLSGLSLYFLGASLPFGYVALWAYRIDKWFDARRFKKQIDQDQVLLEQQFNHRVTNQPN